MKFINVKKTEQGPLATFKTEQGEEQNLDQFEVAKRHAANPTDEQINIAIQKLREAKAIEATA